MLRYNIGVRVDLEEKLAERIKTGNSVEIRMPKKISREAPLDSGPWDTYEIWTLTGWFCPRCGAKGAWVGKIADEQEIATLICTDCRGIAKFKDIMKAAGPENTKRLRALLEAENG